MFKDKNDLTSLPFDKIRPRVEEKKNQLEKALLDNVSKAVKAANEKKVSEYTAQISSNYESNEGVEEAVREAITLGDEDIELTESQKTKIYKEAKEIVLASFISHCNLGSKHSWVLPQMIATFGTWKAIRGENNLYSPRLTQLANTKDNDFNFGLWLAATSPRSGLILSDTKSGPMYKLKQYNHLVPLILAGFKQFQNINYKEWDRTELAWLVDEELGRAMLCTLPVVTDEDVADIRAVVHTTKSGNKAGKQGSPITTASLYHLTDYAKYDLTEVPKLALHMMIQSWVAHPANRSPNVHVLDPADWDSVPKPRISHSVIGKSEFDWGSTKAAGIYDNPW